MILKEEQIIKGCLENDKKFWDIFVQKYSRLIYWAICKRLTLNSFDFTQDDINAIFQEVFLSIFCGNKLAQVKDVKKISGWLAIVASNKAVEFMRRKIRENKRFVFESPEIKDDRFREALKNKESLEVFEQIIGNLSSKEKIILTLKFNGSKTHREIGNILNMPANTVSTVISRAKEKLRSILNSKKMKEILM